MKSKHLIKGAAFAVITLLFSSCISNKPALPPADLLPEGTALEWMRSYSPAQYKFLLWVAGIDTKGISLTHTVDLYKLTYPVRMDDGRATVTAGMMAVPRVKEAFTGTVSWQHGTLPVYDDLPSAGGLYNGVFPVLLFAMGGYITLAPDYAGYEQDNPLYLLAEAEAYSVTGMLDTARKIIPLLTGEKPVWEKLFLVGFSQGGHATLAALKYWDEKAGNVTAAASLAGVYRFAAPRLEYGPPLGFENALYGGETSHTLYLSFMCRAYSSFYGEPLESFLLPDPARQVRTLFDGRHSYDAITEWIGELKDGTAAVKGTDLFSPEFVAQFEGWKAGKAEAPWLVLRLQENAVIDAAIDIPLRLYAGHKDTDVPISEAQYALEKWGGKAELIDLGDLDHEETAMTGLPMVRKWFDSFSD